MKLKVDENLPIEVVDLLRQRGHDPVSVADQQLAGRPDGDVASKCQVEQRAIVTLDLDFAMGRVASLLDAGSPMGRLWIAEEHQVRIREGSGSA